MKVVTRAPKPTSGKLVWIENSTQKEFIIRTGQFSLLNHIKKTLRQDPAYVRGTFKITY
jgi:hypothetical protein